MVVEGSAGGNKNTEIQWDKYPEFMTLGLCFGNECLVSFTSASKKISQIFETHT